MKHYLAMVVAALALVVACGPQASPSVVPDIVTTAPPSSPRPSGFQQSLPPASFPDQTVLPSGVASQPPLVQPGNSPVGG